MSESGVIHVNGRKAAVFADLMFSAGIDLIPGMTRIQIAAYDLAGDPALLVNYCTVSSK